MINREIGIQLTEKLTPFKSRFQQEAPFPHVVIDNFLPEDHYRAMIEDFPEPDAPNIWDKSEMQGVEVKLRTTWGSCYDIPSGIRDVATFFNDGLFLRKLSELTGIQCIIPDPYYTGGGLNLSLPGGHLDVHVDGNYHDAMDVHRRLNLILYLNDNWQDEWGGHLELFNETGEIPVKKIAPIGNRLLIFETHDKTFHGHPTPLACPEGQGRKSLILYYYTSQPRPSHQITVEEPHSALWRSQNWHDKRGNKQRANYVQQI